LQGRRSSFAQLISSRLNYISRVVPGGKHKRTNLIILAWKKRKIYHPKKSFIFQTALEPVPRSGFDGRCCRFPEYSVMFATCGRILLEPGRTRFRFFTRFSTAASRMKNPGRGEQPPLQFLHEKLDPCSVAFGIAHRQLMCAGSKGHSWVRVLLDCKGGGLPLQSFPDVGAGKQSCPATW